MEIPRTRVLARASIVRNQESFALYRNVERVVGCLNASLREDRTDAGNLSSQADVGAVAGFGIARCAKGRAKHVRKSDIRRFETDRVQIGKVITDDVKALAVGRQTR